jgi:hypothetical protein
MGTFIVETLINATYVRKDRVSGATFAVLRYLVASLCYNYDYLNNNLPISHCVHSSPLFAAIGSSSCTIRYYAVY